MLFFFFFGFFWFFVRPKEGSVVSGVPEKKSSDRQPVCLRFLSVCFFFLGFWLSCFSACLSRLYLFAIVLGCRLHLVLETMERWLGDEMGLSLFGSLFANG